MRARAWLAMAVLGLVGVLMLAVFPARALVAQHAERRQVAARIADLDNRNRSLEGRVGALGTDAEIERLARQNYNLVRPNEEVFDIVVPPPPAVRPAPAKASSDRGWVRRTMSRLTDIF
ncbi:MAG: septum formation initiator family protein [Actinomycetota bacterium]|nr:septum formation initiator family protein [Actinomycetota bacterium]MDQ6949327.1 septum formation initiator family protein [Actinomycetota bacterium]